MYTTLHLAHSGSLGFSATDSHQSETPISSVQVPNIHIHPFVRGNRLARLHKPGHETAPVELKHYQLCFLDRRMILDQIPGT